MNDAQYQVLTEELGIRSGLNTWNEFQVHEDNTIVIGGKQIAFKIDNNSSDNSDESSADNSITSFFRIVGVKHKKIL